MILDTIAILNNNKIVWGVTMLLLNMGSKYVMADLGKIHENVLTNEIAKKFIIFSMFFVATRDIMSSLLLSIFYIIVIDGIFHEKRNFSVVKAMVQTPITEAEYNKAKEIVTMYEENRAKPAATNNELYENYLNNIFVLRNK